MALLTWLLGGSGGLGAITVQISQLRPDAVAVPDGDELRNWISTIVLLGLASVVYPQAIQRIYAAKHGTTLKRALSLMTFMPLTTTLVVVLIGIAAIPRFDALGGAEADRVMPLLLGEWADAGTLAAVAAVTVFLGALAAIMSTADSVLLSLGSVVAEDLLGRDRTDPKTTRLGKRVAAIIMIAMVALAMDRSISLWRLIELKMELLIQCVPAFMLAIHWGGLRARPTLWGLVTGTVIAASAVLLGSPRLYGFHVGVLSLAVNLLVAVAGSRFVSAREPADLPLRVDSPV
jgi:Na+/proline symporter